MPVAPRSPTKQLPGHRGLAELDRMAKRGVGEKELSATKKLFGGPLLANTPASVLRYKGKTDKAKVGAFRKSLSLSPEAKVLEAIFLGEMAPPVPNQKVRSKPDNDKATRLIYILDLANETFGDKKLAREFLLRRHPKLKATPLAKLETEWGGREVENILNAMIYGLPY